MFNLKLKIMVINLNGLSNGQSLKVFRVLDRFFGLVYAKDRSGVHGISISAYRERKRDGLYDVEIYSNVFSKERICNILSDYTDLFLKL